jgi:hypothetical protein
MSSKDRNVMTPCEYTLDCRQSVTIRLSLGFPVCAGNGYWYIAKATGEPLMPDYWRDGEWWPDSPAKFKTPEDALAAYNLTASVEEEKHPRRALGR